MQASGTAPTATHTAKIPEHCSTDDNHTKEKRTWKKNLSHRWIRNYLYDHIEKGHKVLPMCDEDECPDFDYFGGGCTGHNIRYFDDDGNEITKEEYEKKGGGL